VRSPFGGRKSAIDRKPIGAFGNESEIKVALKSALNVCVSAAEIVMASIIAPAGRLAPGYGKAANRSPRYGPAASLSAGWSGVMIKYRADQWSLEKLDLVRHLIAVQDTIDQHEPMNHGADRCVLRCIDDPGVCLAVGRQAQEVVILSEYDALFQVREPQVLQVRCPHLADVHHCRYIHPSLP